MDCACRMLWAHCAWALSWGAVALDLAYGHPFFFDDATSTEIYTLSLHDALPISSIICKDSSVPMPARGSSSSSSVGSDRKSTRLNSSHQIISYAVFCLKKKGGTTT